MAQKLVGNRSVILFHNLIPQAAVGLLGMKDRSDLNAGWNCYRVAWPQTNRRQVWLGEGPESDPPRFGSRLYLAL